MDSLTKGERTRAIILDEATRIASRAGFDGLTIGSLADATGLSKSGLFAHFGARDELLLAVVAHVRTRFVETVVQPALAAPRGLPRLRTLFTGWIDWTASISLPGGCPLIGGAVEFDDRPGPIRDAIAANQRDLLAVIGKAVALSVQAGQLAAEVDADQFAFELFGIALAMHNHRRLLQDPEARARALRAMNALIDRHRGPIAPIEATPAS